MLFNITVERTFTGGNLEGIKSRIVIPRLSRSAAGMIGDVQEVKRPCGGSPYRDVTLAIEVYKGV